MKEEEERTPLRTILQNFLNHIEKLDRDKLEGSYDKEFQELKLFSEFLKTSKQYSCSQGEKEVNRKKNRYKDILPFDCSRVILEDYAGIPGSDYINANYIRGASGSPAYIASQGPLPHTVNDFWRMVVQCEVQVIVMACNEEESGKHKCENYWVEHEGEEKQFGMVAIQLIKASVVCPDFLVRTMRLKYTKNHSTTQEERTVCQFHYSAWPDHGVPPLVRPLLDMVRLVRDTQASETLPVLVHCSAGCGRTGTICAIDYVWGLLRAGKLTKDFSLFKLVREMRKQRIAMVQTKEQYVLVHHAVKELFNEQLRMIDSHPYENIDVNGMVKESPEPVYATIKFDSNNEEKQDSNEKESGAPESNDAPPLPCKRKPYTAHTKQEKEVENLTEKQRSSFSEQLPVAESPSPGTTSSSSSSSTCGSLLHKPRIAKLRALFERTAGRDSKSVQVKQRTPQQVTRSHSLGAVRKIEEGVMCIQPIPNRGVLRVPQLAVSSDATYVRTVRPALPIKRSKSLKVLSSGERNKFSVPVVRGGPSQEGPYREGDSGETEEPKLNPKISSPSANKLVMNEGKPYVPPKKVTKDRFSDRKVVKNVAGDSKSCSSQSPAHSLKKSSEDVLLVSPPLSAGEGWRRSLDSLTLESDGAASLPLSSSTQAALSVKKSEPYRLDEEAKKLLQDCRDYLSVSEKYESSKVLPSPERKFQDSLMMNVDSLQHLTVEAQRKVNAVVGGLGTRERRNSFRQAISKELEPGAKSQEYESHQLVKSAISTSNTLKTVVQCPGMDGKAAIEASRARTKAVPMPVILSGSGQVSSGQSQMVSVRSFRPKPRGGQKDLAAGAQYLTPVDPTSQSASKVPCAVQMEAAAVAGYSNLNDRAASSWVSRADSSSTGANPNVQLTENVYVKGKMESSIGVRQELRLPVQNALNHQSKSHNPPSVVPGNSRPVDVHNKSPSEIRISSNPAVGSYDMCDYKNVSVVRRINTTSKGRFVGPSASNTKHFERPSANESETSISNRGAYREITRLPQKLVVKHEVIHPLSVVNEQISINQETVSGIRNSRPAESHVLSPKTPSKSETDHSSSLKHEAPNISSRPKDWPEKSSVAGGAPPLRRPEWSGQLAVGPPHLRPAAKQPWPSSVAVANHQEHRFQPRAEAVAEHSAATSRGGGGGGGSGTSVIGAEREMLRGDLLLTERNSAAARVAPKLSMKVKKETMKNEELGESSTDPSNRQNVSRKDMEAWKVAPGVDVDMVGASIKPSRDHGTALTRALEAFHLRKPSRGAAVSPPQQRKFPQAQQVFVKKQHYL